MFLVIISAVYFSVTKYMYGITCVVFFNVCWPADVNISLLVIIAALRWTLNCCCWQWYWWLWWG